MNNRIAKPFSGHHNVLAAASRAIVHGRPTCQQRQYITRPGRIATRITTGL